LTTGGTTREVGTIGGQAVTLLLLLLLKACRVQLVNVLVDASKELDLEHFCDVFKKKELKCLYDREVYCGLRVKVPCEHGNTCTGLLFPSGKIMLTGLKHVSDVQTLYDKVLVVLN
jgi:TATA-box binding protein (TBP) (component of TFIID and TFIIIB)